MDASTSSPSQPGAFDDRVPSGPAVVAEEKEDSHNEGDMDVSVLALWPVFAMFLIVCTMMVATLCYGPKKVFQEMLSVLVPAHPTFRHMYGIFFAIVFCITMGIPVLLLLLPVPTLMFGFWKGYLITFMSLMVAAVMSFVIGRFIAQKPIRRYLRGNKCKRTLNVLSILEDDESQSMQLLILYRFLTIPMSLRNYGPSILRVPMTKLVLSAIPHSLWSACVFATAGSALKGPAQLLRDGHELAWRTPHWQQIVGVVVACVSMSLFSWIAWRAYSTKAAAAAENSEVTSESALKGTGEAVHYGTNADGASVEIITSGF